MRLTIIVITIMFSLSGMASAWDEVKHDTTETYWPDGSLKERWTSSWFMGNENGFIKNGQYTAWYENGQKSEEGDYLDGLKEYTWIKWYDNGQRAEEISYYSGKKNGRNVAWHENHDIKYIAHYRNDELHGSYFSGKPTYDPNNPDLSYIDWAFYLYGHPVLYFYQSGKFRNSTQQAGTQLDSNTGFWVEWNQRATEFYVGEKVDGEKSGRWTLWSADGQKIRDDIYSNGQRFELK